MLAATIVQVSADPTWAYVMTGLVGLAGIAGTLWQGRRSDRAGARNLQTTIDAENARAQIADKRHTYAQCLAALTQLQQATAVVDRHRRNTETAEGKRAESDRLTASTAALTATWELTLIGRADVALVANTAVEVIGKGDANAQILGLVFSRLLTVMQADLNGIPINEVVYPRNSTDQPGAEEMRTSSAES